MAFDNIIWISVPEEFVPEMTVEVALVEDETSVDSVSSAGVKVDLQEFGVENSLED